MELIRELADRYASAHPRSAAARLHELPTAEVAAFLTRVEPESAAPVVAEMWVATAARTVEEMEPAEAARILDHLPSARSLALLRRLGPEARVAIVDRMAEPSAGRVRHALTLPAGTVGAAADTTVEPVDADATVDEVRTRGVDPRLPYLYVVDGTHRLVGVLHRRDLEAAEGGARIGTVMRPRFQSVPSTSPLVAVAGHGAWSTLDALPVVDGAGAFVGVIRHKDLRAAPPRSRREPGPAAAVTALLDLGEAYWSGLYSAIETISTGASGPGEGEQS